MSSWIATLDFDADNTIKIHDVDGPRAPRTVTYSGDDEDALMALHDEDWLTVGSTWHRHDSGTRWIELEQWVEDEHDGSGPGPEGD